MTGVSPTSTQTDVSLDLNISVPGTFWAFKIAQEVTNRGGNVKIYTSEPNFRRDNATTATDVHTIRHPFFVAQIGHQFPRLNQVFSFTGYNRPFERCGNYLFDRAVASNLDPNRGGLFLGFAGACRNSLRRGNELGYVTAVERSSTHIRTQRRLLNEEYDIHGISGQPVSSNHVRREEQEYEAADYIITPSEFTVDSFREQGVPEEKLVQIPFGTDTTFDPPDPSERDETFSVLYAGRASLRKGIQYLLPAWQQLSLPNSELVIAGHVDDAVEDLVQEYADDDSIRFVGWVDDIDQLYREASVFVLPTIEEGSARVTYEAMAWQLPVITTPHSGWVGADGEHGLEVPIRDPDAVAEAIQCLYEDEALRLQLGANGRELIKSEYTWKDYGDRIWDTYQEFIENC